MVALHRDAAQGAAREVVLLPDRRAGQLVQAPDDAVAVGDHDLGRSHADPPGAAVVAGPQGAAGRGVDGCRLLAIAAGEQRSAFEHRRAVDVGHALEFRSTFLLRDGHLPEHSAGLQAQRHQRPFVRPGEDISRAQHRRIPAAHREGRRLRRPEPSALAAGRIERGDAAIVAAHQHRALPDRRRRRHFHVDLAAPAFLAGRRVEREYHAIEATDDHEAVADTGAGGRPHAVGRHVPRRRPGLKVEGTNATLQARRVNATVGDGRPLAGPGAAFALAHAGGPERRDGHRRRVLGERRRRRGLVVVAVEPAADRAAPGQHHGAEHQGRQAQRRRVRAECGLHRCGFHWSGVLLGAGVSCSCRRRTAGFRRRPPA